MKKCAVLVFALLLLSLSAQAIQDRLRFRVFLTDKETENVLLSTASFDRRQRQGIVLDSTDIPISENYLKIINQKGYPVVSHSRWMNTVVISAPDSSCLDSLYALPFVKSIQLVWVNPAIPLSALKKVTAKKEKYQIDSSSIYGKAETQISMLGLDFLHRAGYKGAGKMIAVVDAGFFGVDTMSWFKNLSLVVAKDFIYPPSSVFAGHSHGTSVLSILAAKEAYSFVGAAPEASYCLLRSEDMHSEYPIEEDYWVSAVEFADSIGVDIVSSSLGYTDFDKASLNYTKNQLDGKTAFISRAAAIAATKGMLLVSSAGNEGALPWQKISFPADVEQVLTVGSVDADLTKSYFSSVGPTSDKRIKPDVMALGSGTFIINGSGLLTTGSGTSFSTPLIAGMAACIWDALPQLKATELLQSIRESGSRASQPDSLLGYGVPNAPKIWLSLKESIPQSEFPKFYCYPNPSKEKIYFANCSVLQKPLKVILYSSFGKKIMEKTITGQDAFLDITSIPNSIYLVEFIVDGERKSTQKILINK